MGQPSRSDDLSWSRVVEPCFGDEEAGEGSDDEEGQRHMGQLMST